MEHEKYSASHRKLDSFDPGGKSKTQLSRKQKFSEKERFAQTICKERASIKCWKLSQ